MKIAKITHEALGEKQSVEFEIAGVYEYLDQIERLLIAAGFSSEEVKEGIIEKAKEIQGE